MSDLVERQVAVEVPNGTVLTKQHLSDLLKRGDQVGAPPTATVVRGENRMLLRWHDDVAGIWRILQAFLEECSEDERVAAPGHVYVTYDFPTADLATLAARVDRELLTMGAGPLTRDLKAVS